MSKKMMSFYDILAACDEAIGLEEIKTWAALGQVLMDEGIVTDEDLNSPIGSTNTQGERVITGILNWGAAVMQKSRFEMKYDIFIHLVGS